MHESPNKPPPSPNFEKLKANLRELCELDKAGLDWFGDQIVAPKQPSPTAQAAPDNKLDFL